MILFIKEAGENAKFIGKQKRLDELLSKPGVLVVANLTDPMLSREDATDVFHILLTQYRQVKLAFGKVVAFDGPQVSRWHQIRPRASNCHDFPPHAARGHPYTHFNSVTPSPAERALRASPFSTARTPRVGFSILPMKFRSPPTTSIVSAASTAERRFSLLPRPTLRQVFLRTTKPTT